MTPRRSGLVISAAAHGALAAALVTGVSWPRPPAPQPALSVALVAVAAPTPLHAPAPPARVPAQAATTEAVAAPMAPPVVAPAPTPAKPAPILAASATLPLPPPAPSHPPHAAAPAPQRVAMVAPARPATAPAASAAPPSQAPAAGAASPAPPSDWLRAIAAWLADHRTYPVRARRVGEQGSVVLRLTIARDGTVRQASVITSSGYPDLDRASLAMVRGAHLPAAAAAAPAEITLRVPIRYALEPSN